ncbi:MAG: S8 family serine peptidase [Sulfolobales archaeon]
MKPVFKYLLILVVLIMQCVTIAAEPYIVSGIASDKIDEEVKRSLLLNGFSEFLVVTNDLIKTYGVVGSNAIRVFKDSDAILVTGDLTLIHKLVNEPSVVKIVPNFRIKIQMDTNYRILNLGSNELRESLYSWGRSRVGSRIINELYNLSGSGIIVAVLDTGVSLDHEELRDKLITINPLDNTYPGGWIEFDRKGSPVCSAPRDTHFHGTWVSSIIAGEFIGIAPKVKLMHGLILQGGEGTAAQLLAGLEWVLEPYTCTGVKTSVRPNIVSLSLGTSGNYSDIFLKPISKLIQKNITIIAAIGNDGPGTTSNPGNIWGVIGVGAINRDDGVADFSSSEVVEWPSPPTEWPFKNGYPKNYIKPDFVSPGVLIPGAYIIDGYYLIASGTSASTPIVSGVTALVLEALKSVGREPTVNEVYDVLNNSASKLCSPSRCGWGIVNAVKAVSHALGVGLDDVSIEVNATEVHVLDTILLKSKHNLTYFLDDFKLGSGTEAIAKVPITDMGYHAIHGIREGKYGYLKILVEPKAIIKNKTIERGEYIELTLLGYPGASDVFVYLGSNLLTYQPLNLLGYASMKLLLPYVSSGDYELLIMDLEGPVIMKEEVHVREKYVSGVSFTLIALSPSTQYVNSTIDIYIISLINGTVGEPRRLYYQFLNDQPVISPSMSKFNEGIYRLSYVATSTGVYVVLLVGEIEVDGNVINATTATITNVTKYDTDIKSVITNTSLEIQNLASSLIVVDSEVYRLKSELQNLSSTLNQLLNYILPNIYNEILLLRILLITVITILIILNIIIIKHLKRQH